MTGRPVDLGEPDRLYTLTGGRHRSDDACLDLVTLVVSASDPAPGMPSEHVRILELCRRPTAVVEVSADLGLPVTVTRILLGDLLATRRVTARHPRPVPRATLPDSALLKQVLDGLHHL
ncbi:DUF742 domain-containing protein [Streptomyces chumphonensis]|uniref:DUF742 domain-containing protein n=1 Tax=Streptomyces chumphonensis TaxID=1214925 RepID=UPI003D758547